MRKPNFPAVVRSEVAAGERSPFDAIIRGARAHWPLLVCTKGVRCELPKSFYQEIRKMIIWHIYKRGTHYIIRCLIFMSGVLAGKLR